MRRIRRFAGSRPLAAGVAVAIVALAAFGATKAIDDGEAGPPPAGQQQPANSGELLSSLGEVIPGVAGERADTGAPDPPGPSYDIARVIPGARIPVHESPEGPVVKVVGAETEFGSPRSFYIAERRGEWLGVPAAALENNELGWIRDDEGAVEIVKSSFSVTADLSERVVQIRYGHRVMRSIQVTIGRAGSETPTGLFAVTDGLAGRGLGPYYGCCALALTGHQPSLPQGWIGGDRIAIHGTPGAVGAAASAGCLRASDRDMVDLFALVPLGTPVFINR